MVTSHQADVRAAAAGNAQDLGPLAWVLDETRKSLESASKSLKRFARESEAARGVDMASVDASQLRLIRQQLHQAVGALEMVSQPVAARMVRGMEAAVQQLVLHPENCNEAAAATLERAGFALMEYLESQLGARPRSALGLFPQFRQVQEMASADRIHPADLWDGAWQWVDPAMPPSSQPLAYGPDVRIRIDQRVLKMMRHSDVNAAAELSVISLSLAAGEQDRHASIFWKLCGGFFQALGQKLLPMDVYAKRAASRILLQYATLARGNKTLSERLTLDLLFFCAQARPSADGAALALAAIRQAWGLSNYIPVNYEQPAFGLYDPAVLAQARRRIEAVKENWSALAGGDMARLKACVDQFGLVAESVDKLYDKGKLLSAALNRVVAEVVQSGRPPNPELAMETATAVLFLEASFTDFHPGDAQFTSRMQQIADRLDSVRGGAAVPTLEPWMEELYRRVSDRQTMGTVVGELRTTLGEVEQHLDQFFRDPTDKSVLASVPAQMSQMRGVLSVLGLDQAALAVGRLSDAIGKFFAADAGVTLDPSLFERIGNSLGALGFQIDMMGYQPTLARKLFVYDAELGELRYVSGRAEASSGGDDADADAGTGLTPVEPETPPQPAGLLDENLPVEPQLAQIATLAAIDERPALAEAANRAVEAARDQNPDRLNEALENLQAAAHPVVVQPEPPVESADAGHPSDEEDELLDIFLEEAQEVVQTARQALQALHSEPGNMEQQTTLRRAFHTLKGSSRMVGLAEFGEAAWAMEQLLNASLAEQKPVNRDLHGVAGEAVDGFARWISDIAGKRADGWRAPPFREAADALRLQGKRMPLASMLASSGTAPAAAAEPAPAPTAQAADKGLKGADATPEVTVTLGDASATHEAAAPPASAAEFPAPTVSSPPTLSIFDLPDLELDQLVTRQAAAAAPPESTRAPAAETPVVPASASGPAAIPTAPDAKIESLEFDLSEAASSDQTAAADGAQSSAEAASDEAAPAGVTVEVADAGELNDALLAEFETPGVVSALAAPAEEPVAPAAATPQASVAVAPAVEENPVADDEYKQIGDLQISVPLYNVYLNEADEWSRQLSTALSEWSLELDRSAPELAIMRAHSLAGSSATVGLMALSGLARAIEHALERLAPQSRATTAQVQTFIEAAEDIRRVLHQFAAGIMKLPSEAILAAVQAIEPVTVAEQEASLPSILLAHADSEVKPAGQTSQPVSAAAAPSAPTPAPIPTPVPTPSPASASAVPAAQPQQHHGIGEGIDVVDAVDPDLFPIFEEEAQELLPRLSASLRQWDEHPDDSAARSETLRALHTLKGSARLAGALRLGEMAHRVESAIQVIGVENISTQDIEPLLDHLDELLEVFGKLQEGGSGVASVGAERTPEQSPEPVAPVTVPTLVTPTVEAVLPASAASLAPAAASEPTPASTSVVRGEVAQPAALSLVTARAAASQAVRVRAQLLDRMLNQAGEVMTSRSRMEVEAGRLRTSLGDLTGNLDRLRQQLRDVELQAETQMQSRMAQSKDTQQNFDPLEFDRFTRMQELTRMMAESVNDVATVQRSLQRALEASEDDLVAQARQSRELQRDLLRTRMVEFESISERLYRVVRQTAKEIDKQVRLDIVGGAIEIDRSVLERMTAAFEHLLRNCVVHGIELPDERTKLGKDQVGTITINVHQAGNDVSIEFRDDGAGLNFPRIRERALQKGLIAPDHQASDAELSNLVFMSGFTTATKVTELAGRGVGMDVVRTEVQAIGGRIETESVTGKGTAFRLILPLTTAVTHVVMVRADRLSVGVPSNLVEIVRRVSAQELQAAYASGYYRFSDEDVPFYWAGALLQSSAHSTEPPARTTPVAIFRSAARRVAVHVDEVLGNQEVVVKALGPQLARLPGMVAMTALASGAVALIYNPVALAAVYGAQARALSAEAVAAPAQPKAAANAPAQPAAAAPHPDIPLVLVVDDSITVRRVTQRLLQREGYRVALAADGLQGLEQLQAERPAVVLSDIEMPRMDGFDFVRNIRADERLRDLPVIMITSRIAAKHRDHADELGVDHYLGKPYSEEELLGLIKSYVRDSATHQAK